MSAAPAPSTQAIEVSAQLAGGAASTMVRSSAVGRKSRGLVAAGVEVVGVRSKLPVHGLPAREEVGVNPKAGTVDGAVCEATIAFLITSGRTWVSSA